jgi:DNA-directed RNA polymerase subunit M/transcription elongation factor TFIIS
MKVTVAELRRAIAGLKDDASLEIHLGPSETKPPSPASLHGYCGRCGSGDVVLNRTEAQGARPIRRWLECNACGRRWTIRTAWRRNKT